LLKPVGVQVTSKIKDLTKFPVWRLAPGATIFPNSKQWQGRTWRF